MRRLTGHPTFVNARAASVARCAGIGIGIVALCAARLAAQGGLTRTDDAATVPRGYARLRVIPSWSRFDSRFVGGAGSSTSTVPLAAMLAAESLGVAQIPGLVTSEQAMRTLTGDPTFHLSLGRSIAHATTRIVTTAFIAEYGLTRHVTLGAVLPLVQSRSDLYLALNQPNSANANVGPNPARTSGTQQALALALQSQLGNVRTALQSSLSACETNPGADPGCAAMLANRADVQALLTESAAFGSAVAVLFGSSSTPATQPFAPLASGPSGQAVGTHLVALREHFRTYVGSTADQITATVPTAVGPAAYGDLQRLFLAGDLGLSPDSLDRVERFNFGDIELGAKLLILERGAWAPASGPSSWLRTRLSLQTVVRLGTGSPTLPRLPHRYLEYGTGDGQTDVEGAAWLDLGLGPRIAVSTAARYTRQLGRVEAGRVPDENGVINPFTPLFVGTRALGDILSVEVTPRLAVGRYFAADAHYALIRRADDEYVASDATSGTASLKRGGFTEQHVGLGFTYSTLRGSRARIPRVPVEVSVAHVETISGSSALVPRATRDQIELRIYYRVRPR